MESSLDLRQVEVEAPLVGHADIDPYARPGRLQEVPARRGSTEGIAAAERKNRGGGGGVLTYLRSRSSCSTIEG